MENLKRLYAELINDLSIKRVDYNENKLTIFSASAGTAYSGKIMIVGRAVNGWIHNLDPSSDAEVQQCIRSVQNAIETENLDWVKAQWGSYEKYNTRKSAFWRLSKAISAVVNPDIAFHTDSIVWTNLYKAAKEEGGNPSGRLINVEFQLCKQILDAEIAFYKPTNIVFLTGLGWATPFLANATKIARDTNWEYVEQVGTYQGCKYIVGQHPQGKNESLHLYEIIRHIN